MRIIHKTTVNITGGAQRKAIPGKIDPKVFASLRKIVGNTRGAHAEFRLLQTLFQEANLAADFVTKLTAVMPPDFKDWHQNAVSELPEIAAGTVENLRKRMNEAEDACFTRDLMMNDMANRLLASQETTARFRKIADDAIANTARAVAQIEEWRALLLSQRG